MQAWMPNGVVVELTGCELVSAGELMAVPDHPKNCDGGRKTQSRA